MNNLKELFTATYTNKKWNEGGSLSGLGSSLDYTKHIRTMLVDLIQIKKIKTIFDCSCGDWNWMKEIKDALPNYIGNDIVEELIIENTKKYGNNKIKFQYGDMLEELKLLNDTSIDLIICRHTLEHLPTAYAIDVVTQIKRVSNFSIITSVNSTTNSELNVDGVTARNINLEIEPYYTLLGNPIEKYYDSNGDKPDNIFGINLYMHNKIS
jgi:ubiquinone/menaquinone biosynthesis C-methylase UbiE